MTEKFYHLKFVLYIQYLKFVLVSKSCKALSSVSGQRSPDRLALSRYKVSNTTLTLLFRTYFLAAVAKILHLKLTENQALVASKDKIKHPRYPRQTNFMFTLIVKIADVGDRLGCTFKCFRFYRSYFSQDSLQTHRIRNASFLSGHI